MRRHGSPLFVVAAVLLVTGAFLFIAWRLWAGAKREPDGFALASAEVRGTVDLGPVPETARSVQWGTATSTGPAPRQPTPGSVPDGHGFGG